MKKRLIFLGIMAFAFLICIVPHVVLDVKLSFSDEPFYYVYLASCIIVQIINIIVAYLYRHIENFCFKPRFRYCYHFISQVNNLDADYRYPYTKKFKKEFFFYFTLLCITIPLYIPFALYNSFTNLINFLCTFVILFLPDIIHTIIWLFFVLPQDIKEYRLQQQKARAELREQQEREEMGRFK